jgi:hypothetical protein
VTWCIYEGSRKRSLAWPHDAPRRNTGKFFGTLEFSGKCVPIRAGRPEHNAQAKLVASMASGILPGPVIGHWPFDAKEPLIVVGDDKEERCGMFGHDRPRAFLQAAAKPGATS